MLKASIQLSFSILEEIGEEYSITKAHSALIITRFRESASQQRVSKNPSKQVGGEKPVK